MLERIAQIEARYHELNRLMGETTGDYQVMVELAKERSDLEEIVSRGEAYRSISERIDQARALENSEDAELRELAAMDLEELTPRLAELEEQLRSLLVPKDKRD